MSSQAVGLAAVSATLGAFLGVAIVISIAWFILQVIAMWKIFTKAGEKGWKALIPVYHLYVQYKITWAPKFFWITLLLAIGTGICNSIPYSPSTALVVSIIGAAFAIALLVFIIIGLYRLAKAYGHGGGWTVGLVFLESIFILMLGFGKSEYKGNVYLEEKNK